jgi:hypothetical protein
MLTAAMSHIVDAVLTGLCTMPAVAGHAEKPMYNAHQHRTVYDVIREMQKACVLFRLLIPSPELREREVIAEIDETVVVARLMQQAMSDGTVTFTF